MMLAAERLLILLADPDDLLAADADALAHPEIEFSTAPLAEIAEGSVERYDAIVMPIDAPAALEHVAAVCQRKDAPPVIAIAGTGWPGRPLEFVLTLAELRGAALGLPRPIDALELALAAVETIGRRRPQAARPKLVKQLQRRLAY